MENSRSDTDNFVVRERYLNAIEAFIDQPVVKVLKGMRRVGKSVIMRLLIERLINRGVSGIKILYINKESLAFDAIKDYFDLYRYAGKYFKEGVATAPATVPVPATTAPATAPATEPTTATESAPARTPAPIWRGQRSQKNDSR